MPEENVEVVRRALDALNRRDVEAYLALASPQIELINPASPIEGPTSGHEGIRRFFSELAAFADTSAFQIDDVRAVGEQVLALFTLTTVGRTSGAETIASLTGVYDLEGGKLRRVRIFTDHAGGLEAVGLPE